MYRHLLPVMAQGPCEHKALQTSVPSRVDQARTLLPRNSTPAGAPSFGSFPLTATLLAVPITTILYVVMQILVRPRRTLATRTRWVAALVTQHDRLALDPPG